MMHMLALGRLLAEYPKLATLGDMAGMRANQITTRELGRVADALGVTVPFTDELVRAFLELLKGHDINSVADMIQSPESVQQIVLFLKGGYRSVIASNPANAEVVDVAFTDEAAALFIQ